MNIDYSKILKAALAQGGEYADLYIEDTRPTAISLEDGKVERVISGVESGAGLRVIIGFRTIFAYTNDLSEAALISLAGRVARACGEKGNDLVIDLRVKKPPVEYAIAEAPELVDVQRKLAYVKEADRVARAYDNRIAQVAVTYRDTRQDIVIACSDGTLASDTRYYTLAAAHVDETVARFTGRPPNAPLAVSSVVEPRGFNSSARSNCQ